MKKFEKLTKAEKRVQIAKDVLEQLKIKRIQAKREIFLTSMSFNSAFKTPDADIQDLISGQKCQACALGALFVCAVDRLDNMKVKETYSYRNYGSTRDQRMWFNTEEIVGYLKGIFNETSLKLIEIAFEEAEGAFDYSNTHGIDADEYNQATNFAIGKNAPTKMRAIMQNIIENNGEFVP